MTIPGALPPIRAQRSRLVRRTLDQPDRDSAEGVMSVEFKDYYRILGVRRDASAEDIRRAFRKLAREHHPDIAKNKAGAEERFKEINEANEVLGDPEKRRKYDQLGADWRSGAEFRPPPRGNGHPFGAADGRTGDFEFHFGGTGFSDFFEQFFGGMASEAAGSGFQTHHQAQPGRDAEADVMVTLEEALHGSTRPISVRHAEACPECHGDGHVRHGRCHHCHGLGQTERVETCTVKVPAGVRDGQRLRLAGRGPAGPHGGPRGDLFLRVRLAQHPDFTVSGTDLVHELELAPWEAVLGAQFKVPTLDGPVEIKIPAGSTSGQTLRLRGRGLSGQGGRRGDQFVKLRVQVPAQITPAERECWEQLRRQSKFNPRGTS